MHIRPEQPEDEAAIRDILTQAFAPSEGEAHLVDQLRQQEAFIISLVAVVDDQIVGHVVFTPAEMMPQQPVNLAALGPVAVLPSHQNNSIGSKLIESGLEMCRGLGYEAVILLGHPEYYPRFGFMPANEFGLKCEWDVPEPAFMIKELVAGKLKKQDGLVKYHPAFHDL